MTEVTPTLCRCLFQEFLIWVILNRRQRRRIFVELANSFWILTYSSAILTLFSPYIFIEETGPILDKMNTFEPVHEISNNVVCATSKVSDQPAHTRSLIRAIASRLSILIVKQLTEHKA